QRRGQLPRRRRRRALGACVRRRPHARVRGGGPDRSGRLMRVLVTGASGQLGAAVVQECAAAHDVVPLPHASLDLLDAAAVAAAVERVRPDAIVNAAAYNFVDQAETRPSDAIRVNAVAVRTLARAARRSGAILVHYSTDFVFDGDAQEPYRETDTPN